MIRGAVTTLSQPESLPINVPVSNSEKTGPTPAHIVRLVSRGQLRTGEVERWWLKGQPRLRR